MKKEILTANKNDLIIYLHSRSSQKTRKIKEEMFVYIYIYIIYIT